MNEENENTTDKQTIQHNNKQKEKASLDEPGLNQDYQHAQHHNNQPEIFELSLISKLTDNHQTETQPAIHVNNDHNNITLQNFRKYQKNLIKNCSMTHPPAVLENKKVHIFDASQEQDLNIQTLSQVLLEETTEKLKRSTTPKNDYCLHQDRKGGLRVEQQSQLLFPGTDSILVCSLTSQQESMVRMLSSPKKNKRSEEDRTANRNQNKQNLNHRPANQHLHGKSQKKVTFIGDESQLFQQSVKQSEKQNKEKEKIYNSFKDDSSMTSILNYSEKNQCRAQQSSRKIISQDQNYCLFRLIGLKKSEDPLMCRSVEIKDDTTEYKQLKLYLLCRENEHLNIVKMHSYSKVVRENGKSFVQIKMDYYPKNLEQYILENKKMENRVMLERKIILFQLLKALNFIHSRNIYHRDLNPHSILIGDQLQVAITNFAYVKTTTNSFSEDNFYECNCYIRPPEVILQPTRAFESGGDMWSFGCIAVYMLKGEMPFFKVSDSELMIQIIKVLGLPRKTYLQNIGFKNSKRFVFAKMYRSSMRYAFRCQDEDLMQMLKKVFVYDPLQRASACSLLASPYFSELRNQQSFKLLLKQYNIAQIFDFKTGELNQQLRDKIVPPWYAGSKN